MIPQRQFIAERPLAAHCPELLRQGPGPAELLPLMKRMGDRLARRLSGALAAMLGGDAPLVSCTDPRETTLDSLYHSVANLAANSLLAVGSPATPMLVSIEAEPVLRIVDRAFGGKGEAPAPMPKTFPMAAEMMIARIETVLADHLCAAVAATARGARAGAAPDIRPMRRDGSLAMLAPFPEKLLLAQITMEVDDGGVLPWLMTFAMPFATLARLFGTDEAPAAAQTAHRRPVDPLAAPFADLPLSLSALVVDMRVPFSTIAHLAPGMVLPVSITRQVPLRVGDQIIARGIVGTLDDRVALQITSAFPDQRTPQ